MENKKTPILAKVSQWMLLLIILVNREIVKPGGVSVVLHQARENILSTMKTKSVVALKSEIRHDL